jgi:hypothetical protein
VQEDNRCQRPDKNKRRDSKQSAEKTAEEEDERRRADQDRDADETEHVRAGGASEQEYERQPEEERRRKQERRRIENLHCPRTVHGPMNETIKGSKADDRCDCCCEREGSETPHASYSETFGASVHEYRAFRRLGSRVYDSKNAPES